MTIFLEVNRRFYNFQDAEEILSFLSDRVDFQLVLTRELGPNAARAWFIRLWGEIILYLNPQDQFPWRPYFLARRVSKGLNHAHHVVWF
jgi:hypothetical protein